MRQALNRCLPRDVPGQIGPREGLQALIFLPLDVYFQEIGDPKLPQQFPERKALDADWHTALIAVGRHGLVKRTPEVVLTDPEVQLCRNREYPGVNEDQL